ncbi:MAG: hypothetical protein ACRDGF_11145 [Chloroflexota bacterium]
MRRLLEAVALTIFLFGLLGWGYIVLVALVHPQTLHLQLTHLLPWPREDTFGEGAFAASFIAFFGWRLLRPDGGRRR